MAENSLRDSEGDGSAKQLAKDQESHGNRVLVRADLILDCYDRLEDVRLVLVLIGFVIWRDA